MPLSASQWQMVIVDNKHLMLYPNAPDRDVDGQLCHKFNALASKKVPTGDPYNIPPPDVKKAQKIWKELLQISGLKTGSSPEKMEINFNKNNLKGEVLVLI